MGGAGGAILVTGPKGPELYRWTDPSCPAVSNQSAQPGAAAFSYFSRGSLGKNAAVGCPFPPPAGHDWSELSTVTCSSWVALRGMAHSSTEFCRVSSPQQGCDCGGAQQRARSLESISNSGAVSLSNQETVEDREEPAGCRRWACRVRNDLATEQGPGTAPGHRSPL